jgi:S1-C subfamily serine protease
VGAQQRIEITTKRTPRTEPADSAERSLRKLQRQLDSLTRVYNEDDQLNAAQRRRVEDELAKTVRRLEESSSGLNSGVIAPTPSIGVRMAPLVAARASAAMTRALMQVREAEQAMPRGWIGIVAQGPGLEPWIEGGELRVRYFSYPRIVSVDPSSPAQRAGITTSDTLLAYDGRDVRDNEISLTRLLRPKARIMVRLLRDGRVHEIPVTVAAAPTRISQRRDDEVRVVREPWVAGVPNAPAFPRTAIPTEAGVGTMRASTRMPAIAQAPNAPTPSGRPTAFFLGFANPGVAGAQMTTVTEGVGQAIGVSSGVFVTSAPVGSPAYESGLRDGDVIVKVGGQAVKNVSEVRDLVGLANDDGEHAIEMEILRQKKTQRLTLKW